MSPALRLATGGLLVLTVGGGVAALLSRLPTVAAWYALLVGLVVVAGGATVLHPALASHPPAARGARRGLAIAFQVASLLLIGVGVSGVDRWYHVGPDVRPGFALALVGLACVGYSAVRLGMTARLLRPAPRPPGGATASPPPPA